MNDMNSMTVIGPGATCDEPGAFVVVCREDGETLVISEDGEARWAGEITLKQAAAGAAKTLVNTLWRDDISEEARAVALVRLYDRIDHDAREASLKGVAGAERTLAYFGLKSDGVTRAISLLRVFDHMDGEARRKALETLMLVGFDLSRKIKR